MKYLNLAISGYTLSPTIIPGGGYYITPYSPIIEISTQQPRSKRASPRSVGPGREALFPPQILGGTQPIIHQAGTGGRGLNGDKYGKAASAVPCTQWGCEDSGTAGSAGFFLQRLRGPELGAPPPPGSSSASVRPARRRFVRGRAGGQAGFPGHRGARGRPSACGEEGAAARPESPPDPPAPPRAPAPPAFPGRPRPSRPQPPTCSGGAAAAGPGELRGGASAAAWAALAGWAAGRAAGSRRRAAARPRPARPRRARRGHKAPLCRRPLAGRRRRLLPLRWAPPRAGARPRAVPPPPPLPELRPHCAAHLGPGAAEGDRLRQQQKNAFSCAGDVAVTRTS